MSLTIEDGTGLAAAESYTSVAAADLYHSSRGNAAWAALATPAKEIALRKATDYLVQTYRDRWDGYRVNVTQALDWPRTQVRRRDAPTSYGGRAGFMLSYYPFDSVPVIVANACADLALRSTTATLMPDQERKVAAERVGGVSVQYEPGSSQQVRYAAVDALLAPLLKNSGSSISLVRA